MQLEKSHGEVLDSVVAALRQVPAVIAIAAYGSTATRSWSEHSDIDLVAVLDRRPPVESIRMFVRGVPVDLNLRAADDSERGIGGAGFVPAMEPIWDPGEVLGSALQTERHHDPAALRARRYLLFHDIGKIKQIADSQAARIAIAAECGEVVRDYFHARAEPFPGTLAALRRLRSEAPDLLDLLESALLADDRGYELLERAGELAFSPVGGAWKPGEIMVVGWVPSSRPETTEVADLLAPVIGISDAPRVYR